MTWAKIDDNIFFNPKVFVISPEAKLLYIGGIVYASKFMTDGRIATDDLPKLSRMTGMLPDSNLVSELVGTELWHETPDGYEINDYLEYNPSREHIETVREKRREAGRKGGRPSQKQIGKQIGKQGGDSYIQDTVPVEVIPKSISQNPFANQNANQIALPQDTEAAAALQAVEDAFGQLRLPQQQMTMDDILTTFDEFRAAGRADWWKAAIDESLKYGGSSWSYMFKVLSSAKQKGHKPGYTNGTGSKGKGKGKPEQQPNDYDGLKARYVPAGYEDIIDH